MTFWGIDLAASKVAIARLPLPETGVLYAKQDAVTPEEHEKRILKACNLAGCVREALKGWGPEDILAIEDPSASRQSHAYSIGEVFGNVLRVLIAQVAGRWFFVAPPHLKMFVTGDHHAPKSALAMAAYKRWGFEARLKGDAQEDEVDAFCLAQIARCVAEPEDFTTYQRDILSRCWVDTTKARKPKNLHFLLRPQSPDVAVSRLPHVQGRAGKGKHAESKEALPFGAE